MSVSLTPSAAERVHSFLAKRGHGVGLRLGVKKTGCSGFAYVVNYADDVGAADVVFEDRGVKVIVDAESLRYVDGTEIDFVTPRPQRGVQVPQSERARRVRLRRELQRLTARRG